MKKLKYIITILITIGFSSCDLFNQLAKDINNTTIPTGPAPLTETEVISGLKEALTISTDTAVSNLSKTNGFFGDVLLKIILPPEAKIITDNMDNPGLKSIGITNMINNVILRMNRSAEEASAKAAPIFINAIKNMSFSDAFGILRGSDTAATHFFRVNTYNALYQEFKPTVSKYLDMDLVGGISTNEAWNTLTTAYNKVALFSSSLTPVNTALDDYVTQKTIQGVFIKVAEQEKNIRKDPIAQVTAILKRVFGT